MIQEKTVPDATPHIGLDLSRPIFDDPGACNQQENRSGAPEDRIRQRAYEIWEREGRLGDPQVHWYRAERELSEATQEHSEATVEDATPAAAVGATESVSDRRSEEITNQKRAQRKRPL